MRGTGLIYGWDLPVVRGLGETISPKVYKGGTNVPLNLPTHWPIASTFSTSISSAPIRVASLRSAARPSVLTWRDSERMDRSRRD